jgi:hypothetical protein
VTRPTVQLARAFALFNLQVLILSAIRTGRPMMPISLRAVIALSFLIFAFASQAQGNLPFKVYVGKVGAYEITKGVNTLKINDGFLPEGTLPVSPTNAYRIKPGQALALLYHAKGQSGTGPIWAPTVPVNGFEKVIRKVNGQEVEMPNYMGVGVEFQLTWIGSRHDEYSIFRMQKSRFNPALPKSEFDRTHGIYIAQSGDVVAASKVPAFARDVNKVAGKVLTAYYLANKLDAQPFLTIEVDFTDVPLAPTTSGKKAGVDTPAVNNLAAQHDPRAAPANAADERARAKEQRDADRAAAREARDAVRADAAAERARKRAEAAALRKAVAN